MCQNVVCPRGAVRSARCPVTAEVVGSNPIGDADVWNLECGIRGEATAVARSCGDPQIAECSVPRNNDLVVELADTQRSER